MNYLGNFKFDQLSDTIKLFFAQLYDPITEYESLKFSDLEGVPEDVDMYRYLQYIVYDLTIGGGNHQTLVVDNEHKLCIELYDGELIEEYLDEDNELIINALKPIHRVID